ncbi:hypothetical protein EYF80_060141 [Liparis tanakae]|uniref:Uncharacterized protein n=1 Tax=Liparis tanakae TaxID=230148 RepID=A0A4Z2EMB5_9TELE|nr:hypothetical protein EYF80_060141 [Liparis tanakae]
MDRYWSKRHEDTENTRTPGAAGSLLLKVSVSWTRTQEERGGRHAGRDEEIWSGGGRHRRLLDAADEYQFS